MSYQPQPGTVASRVIEHLRSLPAGEEIATGPLADAIGLDHPETMNSFMAAALIAGLVVRRIIPEKGRMNWWRMAGVQSQPIASPTPAPAPRQPKLCAGCERSICVEKGCVAARVAGTFATPTPAPIPAAPMVEARAKAKPTPALSVREYVEKIGSDAPAQEVRPFDAWFSGRSGQMYLRGVSINEDGDAILSSADVRVILAALSGVAM